ncbi:MAG: protein phosphatase 2C domain-containing protein, partial [Alphaproteobacteria bacterium]|nr:protein phosphatase 2C domain-containing protein [Alphaproteobacteria bacterium]
MRSPMTPSKTLTTSSAAHEPALPFPPQFAGGCHWNAPWLVGAGMRTGTRHTTAGNPTEDAAGVFRCGPHMLLAIADGAGDERAPRSAEGAQRA